MAIKRRLIFYRFYKTLKIIILHTSIPGVLLEV